MSSIQINFNDYDFERFDDFFKTDDFAEALAIVWAGGYNSIDTFSVRSVNRNIIERFHSLVWKTRPVHSYKYSKKNNTYTQWICGMHYQHPFVLKIKEMGWVPTYYEKIYPIGNFSNETFIKTYINLHHSLDVSYSASNGYRRPRLRIFGSMNVLKAITLYLSEYIGIGQKKVQNHSQSYKTKTIQYTSKQEIPKILYYIKANQTLEKFRSLDLGYVKKNVLSEDNSYLL